MSFHRKIANGAKTYCRERGGNFAVITGLVGLPLVMAIGYAIDYNQVYSKKLALESAIDSAVLASVIPDNMTEKDRENYARQMFDKNYFDDLEITLDIKATRERVDMVAKGNVPTLFGGIIGMDSLPISTDGSAVLTKSDVVCVLALDPSGERAIEFLDDAKFSAPECSVQANSTHNLAMNSEIVTPPQAKSFCTGGLSRGKYNPYIKHACSPIKDPYADLEIPSAGRSCDSFDQIVIRGSNNARGGRSVTESELATTSSGESIIPDYSILQPGIYCRGLLIDGANVQLLPGVYHVWGNLEFTQYASVKGDGVTFIIKGTDNRLVIRDGAEVNLKAPSTGLTAGLVFWQKYLDFVPYLFGKIPADPERVIATSEISSGGGLKIIGTAYLPNHELIISSENSVASQSPATSFIAYRIKFIDKANMEVHVDHEKGGIPPILPRSDDGARLVSSQEAQNKPPDDDEDDDDDD